MSNLRRSRSMFSGAENRPESAGYLGPKRHGKDALVASAVEDEDEAGGGFTGKSPGRSPFRDKRTSSEDPEGVSSPQEGPFSALTPSMWPSEFQHQGTSHH